MTIQEFYHNRVGDIQKFYEEMIEPYLAEFFVSFIFGFLVYCSIIGTTQSNTPAAAAVVGLAIGFGSVALIYTFCDMTLAHFNPAITLAAMVFGKVNFFRGICFIIAQCLGFMAAAGVVMGVFSGTKYKLLNIIRPKKALPAINSGNIICAEAFYTGILVFVAFSVAINTFEEPYYSNAELERLGRIRRPDRKITQPLVIGLTLGFLAFLGLSSSGGVFNPGIVWAPVLFSSVWVQSWAYWVGEFSGGLVGAAIQVLIVKRTK